LVAATVIDEGYIVGRKRIGAGFRRLDIKIARFEGVLEVTNPQTFTDALFSGIGPAKAFGCGLLSLARG
jgi:CRISPR system Cascade subunit CasE